MDGPHCIARKRPQFGKTLEAGLALFAMFFGGGNVIFPLLLGQKLGSATPLAFVGLCITAVLFPLMGLLAIMLFGGDLSALFNRLGRWPGRAFLLVIMAVFGPFGCIPRLITLIYGALKPYLFGMPPLCFDVTLCALLFFCCIRPGRILQLLGYGLTPVLLISLALILGIGLVDHPPAPLSPSGATESLIEGFKTGYMTLDLIAALLFGPLLIGLFKGESQQTLSMRRFFGASGIAMVLLAVVYGGMCAIAAFYGSSLGSDAPPEELLAHLSGAVLGPIGAAMAQTVVSLACFTTAISLISASTDYVRKELSRNYLSTTTATICVLLLSLVMANLGFSGILALLGPLLALCYPALITLTCLSICHKLFGFRPIKTPICLVLLISSTGLLS